MQKKSDEELVKLIREGKQGAIEELFSRYKPVVSSVARSYFLVGSELDDLVQEGMIGLYKACKNFNEKSASFKTFAYLCIKRQIQSAVKQANRQKNKVLNNYISLDSQGGYKTGENGEEEAVLVIPSSDLSPDDEIIERENYEEILTKIKRALSPLELKVLTLYLKGKSYQTISKMVGKNTKSVDNSLHRIKNKLEFLKH